ncbi:MAG: D-aminoacyl-tRNA deacylase, partial [Pseudomonadales bacterium]|nr:D-aminoacyl-tRNA deacylase [Pseudomonadales bacterium]
MKALLQRVTKARVIIAGDVVAEIGSGLLIFLGVVRGDAKDTAEWMARKTLSIRIFDDENKIMNRSVLDVGGSLLVVSQFTLAAETTRGSRPSYSAAADSDEAEQLYEHYVTALRRITDQVETGSFGRDMQVTLENDGPVTIL